MTEAQWKSLQPKQVIQACDEPQLRIALVQHDHLGRWIGVIMKDKEFVQSCIVDTKPAKWLPV